MRAITEVGNKERTFTFPLDSQVHPNHPWHGWVAIEGKDHEMLGWFHLQYVIAVLPPGVK